MISCYCGGDYDWYYDPPEFYQLYDQKRRKRCCSCDTLIDIGSFCGKFECYSFNEYDEEEYFAPKYMCEECTDIFFNLSELGFCITIAGDEGMKDLLKEYHKYANSKKEKNEQKSD